MPAPSDLVARLRDLAWHARRPGAATPRIFSDLLSEAADEIERLRVESESPMP